MKKGKQNFKILTKKEANQVKGGSWMTWLSSWYNNQQGNMGNGNGFGNGNGGGGCPPPEPKQYSI